jgi:hypothetical protein
MAAADSSASGPSAEELFRGLCRLRERGTLRLDLDFARLDHIDSPVAVEADSNIWIYGSIVVCIAVFGRLGLWPGIAAICVSLALYQTVGRAYVRHRLSRRVREQALGDSRSWRQLWQFGGVSLVVDTPGAEQRCTAPGGNWMALVRELTS